MVVSCRSLLKIRVGVPPNMVVDVGFAENHEACKSVRHLTAEVVANFSGS